jgi:hypothetical protein
MRAASSRNAGRLRLGQADTTQGKDDTLVHGWMFQRLERSQAKEERLELDQP